MKTAPNELKTLIDDRDFAAYHKSVAADLEFYLAIFLDSSMDEARTEASRHLAELILSIIGLGDFGIFREAVLAREVTGNISYPDQRDHSAHTINNYLLGWYFYVHCPALQQAFSAEFKKRGLRRDALPPFSNHTEFFGHIWQYASVLHDVGYMFEGNVANPDLRMSNEQASIGANAVREYFQRTIWLDYSAPDTARRHATLKALRDDYAPPPMTGHTLGEIADSLQYVGDVSVLSKSVDAGLRKLNRKAASVGLTSLLSDAFALWSHHFQYYGNTRMAERMTQLGGIFTKIIKHGMTSKQIRILDHGVCSGLLQLLASTYYYRLKERLKRTPKIPYTESLHEYPSNPAFWWTGIVWATAATALHNVQQMGGVQKLCPEWRPKISLEEDPLTFLGVLVDTIQEWDRYSVFKRYRGAPIQGVETRLAQRSGLVRLQFSGHVGAAITSKVKDELHRILDGWEQVLTVLNHVPALARP